MVLAQALNILRNLGIFLNFHGNEAWQQQNGELRLVFTINFRELENTFIQYFHLSALLLICSMLQTSWYFTPPPSRTPNKFPDLKKQNRLEKILVEKNVSLMQNFQLAASRKLQKSSFFKTSFSQKIGVCYLCCSCSYKW